MGSRSTGNIDWQVPAERTVARCHALAAYSESPDGLTRTFLSPPMHEVHREIGSWMRAAGMTVRSDAIGNLIGHKAAADPDAPILLVGSHLDTVRNAGHFDGILGVMAGVTVVETLQAPLPFHLEVIGFSEEEGVRFGVPYFGSYAVCGRFDPTWLQLRDADGVTLEGALRAFGCDPAAVATAAYEPERLLGFVELHIEQGPRLEAADRPVGVAEAIVGQSRLELSYTGRAGHAGTTPMPLRHDALAGAAELVLAAEAKARSHDPMVATVGTLEIEPGAGNVIPGRAQFSLDLRHQDDPTRRLAVAQLVEQAQEIAAKRGLNFSHATRLDENTHWLDRSFIERLGRQQDLPLMVSGAGHDAAVMSAFTRTALLFVRSPGGISHHPDERVETADVAIALEAMTGFVHGLANELASNRQDPT